MPAEGALALTGATGFVGGEVLVRVLEGSDRDVVLPIRGDAEPRALATLHRLGVAHLAPRVRAIRFEDPLPADVTTVVHAAADVRFDRSLEDAREANVETTRRLLDRAAALPALGRIVHVSTAFVAGAPRNTYEQTKAEAEAAVRTSGLPHQIVRPSIVVGDQHTGWTTSFNVIYAPLRAFARGLLTAVPGRLDAPVDVVPVDHVADAILTLLEHPCGRVHAVVAGDRATTVGELAADAARALGRPVPPPGDAGLAELLPYFAVDTPFAADPALPPAPTLREYLPRLLAFAETARWGRALPAVRPRSALVEA